MVGHMLRPALLAVLLLHPLPLLAADKVALVIGMGDYETIPALENPVRDAEGVADTLEAIGFDVTRVIDQGADRLRDELGAFAFRSETAEIALVYYAGHGVEVQGENFLIPVDAAVGSNRDVQRQAVSLDDLLTAVDSARAMRVVILDSCRDNPFGDALDLDALAEREATEGTRSAGGGGLAPPSPDRGTLVAFAARAGEVALDGIGEHSPFAQALMDAMDDPGLEISLMFRKVRDEVLQRTRNRQEPYTYGSLSGEPFYLAGPAGPDSEVASDDLKVAWSDLRPEQEVQLAALAEGGDTRSMVGLAYMRLNEADPRYAPEEAADWLHRAAEAGSPEAQFELGKLYEAGLGVEPDPARALELYEAAAAQDFPDAINDLGFLHYQGGLGLVRDPKVAIDLFRRAAELRHPQAMYNTAALIDDGIVPGAGPEDAGRLLYLALRAGSEDVYTLLRDKPDMFKDMTRRALQERLKANGFYGGALDADLGPGTQRGIRAAYGLSE